MKMYLALNNLQWLICHKTKLNQTNLKMSGGVLSVTFIVIEKWNLQPKFKSWTRLFVLCLTNTLEESIYSFPSYKYTVG